MRSAAVQNNIGFNCPSFLTRPSGEGIDKDSSRKLLKTLTKDISQMWQSSVTFGRPLNEMLTSLSEVYEECSRADWNGYGAEAITSDTYKEARTVIYSLPFSMPVPDIVAEPTGDIGFEWRRGKGHVFVASVGGKHQMTYAGLFGSNSVHGSEYFEGALPSVIIQHIRRLYS